MEYQILVVGIGPGSREYMLPAAWEAIATAKTLVGGRRALETLAPPEAKRRVVDADIEGLLNYIEEESRQGQVVVMVSGVKASFSQRALAGHSGHQFSAAGFRQSGGTLAGCEPA